MFYLVLELCSLWTVLDCLYFDLPTGMIITLSLQSSVTWKESYDQPRQHIKKQRHYFANKGPSSQGYDFSSSPVWMWELDYKESWAQKNWCFWTVVLEKTLESPLDCKKIQPVHPKRDQFWVFIGRTDVEAEIPILGPPDAKRWFIGKKNWCWERLRAGEERDDRGWDGWMASPTRWTWIWVDSGSWWWTGRPGELQSMGSQRVRHDWATKLKLNWNIYISNKDFKSITSSFILRTTKTTS